MRFKITESQYQKLLEGKYYNYKPAREFDKFYDTNLAQSWEFPRGLDSDAVWDVIQDCWEKGKCLGLRALLDSLDEKHFPYSGLNELDDKIKIDVLQGMASELNYDDIVHFAIEKKTGLNDKIFNKFHKSQKPDVQDRLQWISSPKTLKIIKKTLKDKSND
jgi:hypothetical protein